MKSLENPLIRRVAVETVSKFTHVKRRNDERRPLLSMRSQVRFLPGSPILRSLFRLILPLKPAPTPPDIVQSPCALFCVNVHAVWPFIRREFVDPSRLQVGAA